MKIIIGAGGTGGHIIPALAVGMELRSRKWDVKFLGNKNSMEENLVKKQGFSFYPIRVQKLYRKLTCQHLRFPFLFGKSLLDCILYMRRINPDVILCTGGFVSGPIAISSIILNKRLYLQDGNSYPGFTTRLLAKYSYHIFTAFDAAKKYLKRGDCIKTGNPILPYKEFDTSQINWEQYNLSPSKRKLLVIGGSQGSVIINQVISECSSRILELGLEIIWQTGKTHYSSIRKQYEGIHGIHMFDFTDKMNDYYQMSDIAIARAGALTISELNEHKIPAIFIPLPNAAENHQYKNALDQANQGLAILLEQRNLSPQNLLTDITELLDNQKSYQTKFEDIPYNNATQVISDIIERENSTVQE